ncbi:TonB-dependent receptor domain-containing protein, partial [Rhodoblastus sp.]|uniref:TonB-dependent receptor domain-containing protein n=1 Tax=Rhodoblastus sp. TaxID=1962975 RepID=UPI003F9A34A4
TRRPSSKPKKPVVAHVAAPALPVAAPARPVVVAAPQSEVERAEEKFDATQKASSELFTTGKEINAVPFSRPGEALETAVPGLMVTQHSGEGKANQYQLRGFQLDHGTDFEITLDGMPLNMPTHGHGQGYADANFLIPELFSYIIAKKGPYFADEGDFSSAGAVHIQYKDELPGGLFSATAGSFDYGRLLGVNSDKLDGGNLLSAVEFGIYNGPWTVPDEMHKINGVLRWSRGTDDNGVSITAMAYANRWHASNQIPERAVTEGVISLWGNIDPTDRGDTTRFSLSTRWSEADANSHSRIEAYAIHSTLDLFNNFDYYLTQPIIGDQFRQFDRRTILGLKAEHGWNYEFASFPMETRIGLQSRYDNIRVGLQDTYQTVPYDTLTNDQAAEGNVGVWTDTTVKWSPWLRTTAGLRGDFFAASIGDYQDPLAAPTAMPFGTLGALPIWTGPWNSGSKAAVFDSPKASVVLGPWEKTEFFLNFGEGFHSTDARGTVTTLNPPDGSQATPIPLLVKSRGAEIGARTKFIDGLDSTVTFWWLNFDSESQFDGDTGTTLFGRPSRRYGIELTNRYTFNKWLRFDGDLSLSHARSRGWDMPQTAAYASLLTPDTIGYFTYLGNAPGNYIPEAPPVVASIAVELGEQTGWFGALKFRFKGVYPLTEDGYFKAPATGWLDLRGGYRWENGLKLQIDGFNVLNSKSDQITYAYGSLLPTDPLFAPCQNGTAPAAICAIGQMDRHFKPMEPLAARVTLSGPLSTHAFDPVFAPAPDARTPYKDLMAFAANVSSGNLFPPDDEGFMALAPGLPNKKGPPPAPTVAWTGPHVGLNAGGIFGTSNLNVVGGPVAPGGDLGAAQAITGALTSGLGNFGDFLGGGQIGYDWQLGQDRLGRARFVVGVEADIQAEAGAGVGGTLANAAPGAFNAANTITGNVSASEHLDYFGTARVRAGYLLKPNLLLYATGGLAYGQAELTTQTSLLAVDGNGAPLGSAFGSTRYSNMLVGWTAGGGFEWMFQPNWSVRAEYLYYDLGAVSVAGALPGTTPAGAPSNAYTLASQASTRFNGNVVRGGLNYHFDWGTPAPVIAKY